MKAKIINSHSDNKKNKLIELNTEPHNIKYSHVSGLNCIFVQLHHFPRKDIMQFLANKETGEIKIDKGFIRACIKVQGVRPCLVIHYTIKTEPGQKLRDGEKSKCLLTEKEVVFPIDAENREISTIFSPLVFHLAEVNTQKDYTYISNLFDKYMNPKTFADLATLITPEQERKAVEILRAYFDL